MNNHYILIKLQALLFGNIFCFKLILKNVFNLKSNYTFYFHRYTNNN